MPAPDALPTDLIEYARRRDGTESWAVAGKAGRTVDIDLVSQTWRGIPWTHRLALVKPERPAARDAAILYITGGSQNPLDMDEARSLARDSGLAVAMLFHVPNQPLFGWVEDDLIAHTLVQRLESGERDWPLLLPMVKSAVVAMDALAEFGLARFVVTGGSKRGWTAWLTAATADPRVVGIAPMVFDNLNVGEQLRRQSELWGAPSEMIEPYTSRGLDRAVGTPEGKELVAVVDPYTYREALTLPKLVVTGSNDAYWATDAMSLYWDGLVGPKWACTVPNAGHGLGEKHRALATIAAFARSCAGKFAMPDLEWSHSDSEIAIRCKRPLPASVSLWIAESETLDFRDSVWSLRGEAGTGSHKAGDAEFTFRLPQSSRNLAAMLQLDYAEREGRFHLSTPIRIYPAGPR